MSKNFLKKWNGKKAYSMEFYLKFDKDTSFKSHLENLSTDFTRKSFGMQDNLSYSSFKFFQDHWLVRKDLLH